MPEPDFPVTSWEILTGEYPPQPGGVSDYTRRLAQGLAARGGPVRVWCPGYAGQDNPVVTAVDGPVVVDRLRSGFGPPGLRTLSSALGAAGKRRLLVQYVPNAFGLRGTNVPFTRWLLRRRKAGDDVRVMFHEPFLPWESVRHWPLAAAQRLMAATLLRAARCVYVSTESWAPCLRPFAPAGTTFRTLPIPSNIDPIDDLAAVSEVKTRLSGGRKAVFLIGYFGTYRDTDFLQTALSPLLSGRPDRRLVLLGGNGDRFATLLAERDERFRGRIEALGFATGRDVSIHLQACDLMVQPYPDGVTTRRTTVMACLAHARPTLTNVDRLSEPFWSESPVPTVTACRNLPEAADRLLGDAGSRVDAGRRGLNFYEARFALNTTLDRLCEDLPEALHK